MKNKKETTDNHQPAAVLAHGNSVLRLPKDVPGLIVLSKYNDQYQQDQKKSFWKRLIKKIKQKEEKNEN